MVDFYPGSAYGGYQTLDDPSPKSMRGATALAANPLPYLARMVVTSAAGDISIRRQDGTTDVVWCIAGQNPYLFDRLVADAGGIVKDVHF